MKKYLVLLLFIVSCYVSYAQEQIEIGKAVNNKYIITADTSLLKKALQQTLTDGTIIHEMHIESVNQWHYLIGKGLQKNYQKTIAVQLQYDIRTRTYYAVSGLSHITCASAGCNACTPFKENGKIIGCHCTAMGTVSNECNFKQEAASVFYGQLIRYLKMKRKI